MSIGGGLMPGGAVRGEPIHRSFLAVDIQGYGRPERDNRVRLRLRATLRDILDQALSQAGIGPEQREAADLGDGLLFMVDAAVSKARLVNPLIAQLTTGLAEHNYYSGAAEQLRLRVVLHAGEVHRDEHGWSGEDLNLAFRLLDSQPARACLWDSDVAFVLFVSDTIYQSVVKHGYGGIDANTFSLIEVNAKETIAQAWAYLPEKQQDDGLDGPISGRLTGRRRPGLRPWPIVGRRSELAYLAQTITDPAAGGMVVVGEAGVGKTRLWHETLDNLDPARYAALRVVATRSTSTIPFGTLASLLPADLPGAADRANLLRLAGEILIASCGQRRVVLGIDDVPLLDDQSTALVCHLVRGGQAVLLATARSGQPPPEPIMALWKDEVVEYLELHPLSQPDIGEVLAKVFGGAVDARTLNRLWDVTRGNPFYLREVIAAGLDAGGLDKVEGTWRWRGPLVLANRLVGLVQARIGRLNARQQAALELVAFGEPIGVELLARLVTPAVIEELEDRGLVWVERSGRRMTVRLGHPLHSEIVRARCPALRARTRARQLAEVVEASGARRLDDLLRVATWQVDSGKLNRPELLIAAASRAFAMLELELAERLGRAALAAGGGAVAARTLGQVLMVGDQVGDADPMLARLVHSTSGEEHAQFAISRAFLKFFRLDDPDGAAEVLQAARHLVTEPALQEELDAWNATMQVFLGQTQEGIKSFTELLDRPPRLARVQGMALSVKAQALAFCGRLADATTTNENARQTLPTWREECPYFADFLEFTCFWIHLLDGALAKAEATATAGYDAAIKHQLGNYHGIWCVCIAQALRLRGRVRDALRWCREGLSAFRNVDGGILGLCLGELALAAALSGDPREAQAALSEADRERRQTQQIYQPWVELAQSWVAAARGDMGTAIRISAQTAATARLAGRFGFEAIALHDLVRLGAADRAAVRLSELATVCDGRLVGAYAAHATACVNQDGAGLEAAAVAFEEFGAMLLAAEAATQAAAVYRAAGHGNHAHAAAARARRLTARCQGAATPLLSSTAPALAGRHPK